MNRATIPSQTRIIVMARTFSLADVKARFSEIVDLVAEGQERVVVTRHGKPAAVLIGPDDLESLEETLEVLSNPQLMASLRESEAELARGVPGTPLEEVIAEFESKR
jgi:prevent-host-death family protein